MPVSPDLIRLAVLNGQVDKLGLDVFRYQPGIGNLILKAGDLLQEAGRTLDVACDLDNLNACNECGCTVEDGECVCNT